MGMSGGKGSSSGSQQVQMTPEQQRLLTAQTDFLTGTAFPTYKNTIGMAGQAYGEAAPAATQAAERAIGTASRTGALQELGGTGSYLQGMQGLSTLFSPQYEKQQIAAALQPAQEAVREEMAAQNAMYGGAGAAGSARQALASRNLASLSEARLGNVAAQTAAGIAGQRQAAATTLLGSGQQALQGAQQSAASQIGYAQTPQDLVSKYAAVVYGTPQGSTTADFKGTQGTTGQSSSKGGGFKI
jgi:hypothetical protein